MATRHSACAPSPPSGVALPLPASVFGPETSKTAFGDIEDTFSAFLSPVLKFPRFRGHPNICVPGVHNGQKAPTLHAGVPAAADRAGSVRSKSGEPGEGVRADGT